ncbi:MAG: hypothetical protein IPN17_11930 [Deltaproteobacteria bacterium]|jgi:hypothetical protein|nr:hypothetical protein [Deltaproteobacteria bacterium]MBK7064808.1 hypothetical protein [Deltaproteobacteria bacterium]MBK8692972.1 hypothetical protein [Deltaproteobacteria bacterium]MBP6834488.1 hypothetical protein [Deltaproteobacteria bacterium]
MADSYIDPRETLIYGAFARDQFAAVCMGLVPALDGAVKFASAEQAKADAAMKDALDRLPAAATVDGDPVAEARDALVRFGKYIESIKGAPVALSAFFDRDAPSTAARRRLTKLVALVKHVSTTIEHHKGSLRDYRSWQEEFRALHSALASLEQAGRESKLADAMLRPELAAAREAWLSVYTANKALISGVLRHAGRIELLPLVFDDLAEQHRAAGVSDATPTPAPVDPQPTA